MYVQDGIDSSTLRIVYDKNAPGNGGVGAVDPQMSPDGRMVAFVKDGEIFVAPGEGQSAAGSGRFWRVCVVRFSRVVWRGIPICRTFL